MRFAVAWNNNKYMYFPSSVSKEKYSVFYVQLNWLKLLSASLKLRVNSYSGQGLKILFELRVWAVRVRP